MDDYKKLMQRQIINAVDEILPLTTQHIPKSGWINTIRKGLGVSAKVLAKKMNCSIANVSALEKREVEGKVTLEMLQKAAEAMNCKLIYFIVPEKPILSLLEERARLIAKRELESSARTMALEGQALTQKQLKFQEDELVKNLLSGNMSNLWDDDDI